MKAVAIIQARMGSTRLPGKVLMRLGQLTVLEHVVRRTAASHLVSQVVVATTTEERDDPVAKEAERCGAMVYRGSEDDVLDRYCGAAKQCGADVVIRITADCPLLDSDLLTDMLNEFIDARSRGERLDYLSNTLRRTFPRGLDIEIFSSQTLDTVCRDASQSYEREHVTPFIYRHPDRFTIRNYSGSEDLSGYRLTLDTPEDMELLTAIFRELDDQDRFIDIRSVVDLLRRQPELAARNAHVQQNETYQVGHSKSPA